ncbi:hypothetical protein RHMOL_Rhmol08G0143600 [Rhododendron molle]|uniref:Uncharacterized protein n=1 Tax=Rhododendron molle TaxID=49168 RepID=A0ACC0MNG0_RHOML|nr:hypothetical protein RHMOL_Rhmol08G0143600 [Rhododendron molle]
MSCHSTSVPIVLRTMLCRARLLHRAMACRVVQCLKRALLGHFTLSYRVGPCLF